MGGKKHKLPKMNESEIKTSELSQELNVKAQWETVL